MPRDPAPGRPDPGSPAGPIARGSVARVGVATVLSALCGYAVLYLAARDLDPAGFAVFGVFWGAFGLVTGAANGLLQETTREVRRAQAGAPGQPASGHRIRPLRVAGAAGVAAAALVTVSSPLWSRPVFVEARWLSVGLLSVGLVGFAVHATLSGALAGVNRWSQYGALMVTDAGTRVLVAAVTFVLGWGLSGYLWATVAGAVAWLLMLAGSPSARATARLTTPVGAATFLRGAAHSITAAGAGAVLVMGFPVLLQATYGELGVEGGVVILAVMLTRAPLLVPLTALQGNLIAHFIDERPRWARALAAPAAFIVAAGSAGAGGAALAGPWLLRAAFGPDYRAGRALLAGLTMGATTVALLTLTGAAAVAAALHRAYALGWVGATVASTLLLLVPVQLGPRTVVALLCGPLVGIAVHLIALRASSATAPAVAPAPR